MTDDSHALSGAYAVDALDPDERTAFERHLAGCRACQDEVASLRAAAAELSGLVETSPPARLRESVLRQVGAIRPLPPLTRAAPSHDEPSRPVHAPASARPVPLHRRSRVLAAIAAALVVVGGLAVWRTVQTAPPPTVAEQVLDAPDAARVAHALTNGGTATVVRSKEVGRAVLVTTQLPPAPAGKVYQLWLQDPSGAMHPAGFLPAGGDQVVVLTGDVRDAAGAGITIEPAGGSPQPTSKPLALFAFSSA